MEKRGGRTTGRNLRDRAPVIFFRFALSHATRIRAAAALPTRRDRITHKRDLKNDRKRISCNEIYRREYWYAVAARRTTTVAGLSPHHFACAKRMISTQALNLKDLHDTDVMSGVRAHNRRALERLYLTYYGSLARFLSRIVAETGAVEGIINDTFITIWKCAKEFRGESRVAAWIVGIAYRTALQSTDRHGVRGHVTFTRRNETDSRLENYYIDHLECRLNRLPLEERVTLALAYQMGFSIDEIAEITQVAPATVKVRMLQARLAIQAAA